jgi:hypothetical protein
MAPGLVASVSRQSAVLSKPFPGLRADPLGGLWLQRRDDACDGLGGWVERRWALRRLGNAAWRWASGSGLVLEADSAVRGPAVHPARHAAAGHLGQRGKGRPGDPWVTEQEAMRPPAGASGGVRAMPLGEGWDCALVQRCPRLHGGLSCVSRSVRRTRRQVRRRSTITVMIAKRTPILCKTLCPGT